MEYKTVTGKWFLVLGALFVWFAAGLQFYLILLHRTAGVGETVWRFFTFFTILTNLLAGLCYTIILVAPQSATGYFFRETGTQTALGVYICIVAVIYNMVLRGLRAPTGLDSVANEMLHVLNPVWYILFWIFFVPGARLPWVSIFRWSIYPLLYLTVVLIRGHSSAWYPYPFLNVTTHGMNGVLRNCLYVFGGFLVLGVFFVAVGRWKRPATNRRIS